MRVFVIEASTASELEYTTNKTLANLAERNLEVINIQYAISNGYNKFTALLTYSKIKEN